MDVRTFIGMMIRHALGAAGGGVGLDGLMTGSEIEIAAGAIATLVSVGWSARRKLARARAGGPR